MARSPSPNDNPNDWYALTPHASADEDLPTPISAIAFSAEGTLHVNMLAGGLEIERTIPSGVFAAGIAHPMQVTRFYPDSTVTNPWGGVNAGG